MESHQRCDSRSQPIPPAETLSLANRPRLLLADEPTANVDPANQQIIIDLIRETCREEEITLVLVTHSTEVASQFDRVDRLEDVNRIVSKNPAIKAL